MVTWRRGQATTPAMRRGTKQVPKRIDAGTRKSLLAHSKVDKMAESTCPPGGASDLYSGNVLAPLATDVADTRQPVYRILQLSQLGDHENDRSGRCGVDSMRCRAPSLATNVR